MRKFKKIISTVAIASFMTAATAAMAGDAKPSIKWMPEKYESGASIDVNWAKWWGTGITSWKLENRLKTPATKLCEETTEPVQGFQEDGCTVTLPDGTYSLVVTATDSSGDSNPSEPYSITVGNGGVEVDPSKVTAEYVLTSEWPGGRVININVEGTESWIAVVKYNGPVELSIWAGTAAVSDDMIIYTPSKQGTVQAQLEKGGRAVPEESYIKVGTHKIPFTKIPEAPAPTPDTYHLDPANYMETGTIKIGQRELVDVWGEGPVSMMIPNERKRWAMGLAHASQLFKNVTGTDDVYAGVNHMQGTILQESRFCADPETPTFTYPYPTPYPIEYRTSAAKDGFFQIEGADNGGSAYGDLVVLYPNRLAGKPHQEIVSTDHFETAAITGAYYNIFSYFHLVGKSFNPKDFFSKVKDPQALDRVLSLMYNRGVYEPTVESLFETHRDYCINLPSLLDKDAHCMLYDDGNGSGDYGALYVRQVPGLTKALVDATVGGAGNYPGYYETTVQWSDVSEYLDKLTILYGAELIASAKKSAKAAFDKEAGTGTTITFSTQFGKVLDAIMLTLPVDSPQNKLCEVFGRCGVEK